MQPLLAKFGTLYRGPANSNEYNALREALYFDILNLYNIAATNQANIENNMDILMRENYFMQNKIIELERMLDDIQTMMASSFTLKYLSRQFNIMNPVGYVIPGYSDAEVPVPTSQRAHVDIAYKIAHLPIVASYNKIYFTTADGDTALPETLDVSLYESIEEFDPNQEDLGISMNLIDEEAIYNAFDGSPNTTWLRQLKTSEPVDILYACIYITLPRNMINHAFVNTISLRPAPEFALSLMGVQYKSLSGGWQDLPSYPTEDNTMITIPDISKIKLVFPKTEMTEIRIFIKQPYSFLENDERVFTYGFHAIEVAYEEHSRATSSFISHFDLKEFEAGLRFKSIKPPIVIVASGSIVNINHLVSHKIYYELDDGTVLIGSFDDPSMPGTCSSIYIKTDISARNDGATPVIQNIGINFETQ